MSVFHLVLAKYCSRLPIDKGDEVLARIMDTIFIQIAAYRDRELVPTVEDAIAQATHPERISFGICWQYEGQEEIDYIKPLKTINNCRIKAITASKSGGLGWARSQTEKLWRGERYTLQIDAHMRFAEGWDTLMIEMLSMCPSQKPILTTYPPAYEPPRKILSDSSISLVAGTFSEVGVITPQAGRDLSQCTAPEEGAFVAGGFMFADASIIRQVPHDPHIYFSCTEVLYAARAWTRGWDIYYPHRPACWHYYNSGIGKRPLHWTDHQKWGALNQVSQQRFRQILKMEPSNKNFGIYDLGKTRTLAEYEAIAGVNFRYWRKKAELELLICCICTDINAARYEQINTLIQKEIDWNYLLQIASQYQLIPLLYWTINNRFRSAVPEDILSQLQNDFYGNAQHNMFLTQELLDILSLFKDNEIPAIPFKGPVLATLAYNNLLLRQFTDLDILVHPRDIQKAKELLISQGYHLRSQLDWEYDFVHQERQVNVDLHQTITPSFCSLPFKFDYLWSRLKSISLAGTNVLSLQAEDLLLILVAQSAKDLMERRPRLSQICDIAELIRAHQEMDWEYVLEQAKTLGNQRILFLNLLLATDMLGITLPETVRQRMEADSVVKLLAKQVEEMFFYPNNNLVSSFLFYFKVRERLWDKVKFLLIFLIPDSEDRMLMPLPEFLSFLYTLTRPFRLVGKALFARTNLAA